MQVRQRPASTFEANSPSVLQDIPAQLLAFAAKYLPETVVHICGWAALSVSLITSALALVGF
jgi:hypothetical protein